MRMGKSKLLVQQLLVSGDNLFITTYHQQHCLKFQFRILVVMGQRVISLLMSLKMMKKLKKNHENKKLIFFSMHFSHRGAISK